MPVQTSVSRSESVERMIKEVYPASPIPEPVPLPIATHQVGGDRQETEDGAAERRRSGDDALRFLVHRTLTVPSYEHLLVLELPRDVIRA